MWLEQMYLTLKIATICTLNITIANFPSSRKQKNLPADTLMKHVKLFFQNMGKPKRIMSDAGSNGVSEKF